MRTTNLLVALSLSVFMLGAGSARGTGWEPSPGHTQVAIWPGEAPDAQPAAEPETVTSGGSLIGGKPVTGVENVSRPTMTVYPPSGTNTGVAVVVFPGGGYQDLAIDLEGTEVCDWLTARGITCVLLKYRVPHSGPYWDAGCKCHITPKFPIALEDAQRTISLVRAHAAEWKVDPHKIGVLGFSAGGHLVAATSTHFGQRSYPPQDAADQESCRPDFAVAVYPGHLWVAKTFTLSPDVPVTRQTPPTFLLQAEDDDVDNVNQSLVYYIALKRAGVPVEMHLYAQGGHAFGLRTTRFPITAWPQLVETWLGTIGMTGTASANGDFSSGVDLLNEDPTAHRVTFEVWPQTTAICEAREGNHLGLKNGLPGAADREGIKGFKRIPPPAAVPGAAGPETVEAEIAPNTHVNCLCVRNCRVKVDQNPYLDAASGQTLVIRDSVLSVEKAGR